MQGNVIGRVARAVKNNDLMGTEMAVIIAVLGGWRVANNIVGDWMDKGIKRT